MGADTFDKYTQEMPTGCIEWTGYRDRYGYGRHGKLAAYRVSYERSKGVIPKGMSVCHTCDNPPCVNPEHLWLGSNKENLIDASNKGRSRGQSLTHCKNGHEYTPANTYWRPSTNAARDCRICIKTRVQSYRKRKQA